jgi:[pyruvate, water dikinase]-phosphate phosphotransferase / [pyruvate, water dikinase] kinase
MRNDICIHLISDSTGETVSAVARAAMAQFGAVKIDERSYTLIRSLPQLTKALDIIRAEPGPVMYTLVKKDMRSAVREFCETHQLPCISVLGNAITQLSAYVGIPTAAEPGRQHGLDESYFARVEAINFALSHDDGQNTWNLDAANIILVGPSRTSKSPTCVYLANKGLRVANVPFVKDCVLPETLFSAKKPLIVGLTIDVERLFTIRESRLATLGQHDASNYVDKEAIAEEVLASKRLFAKHRWPVIDVTRRSVEETAAHIIQLYQRRKPHGGEER